MLPSAATCRPAQYQLRVTATSDLYPGDPPVSNTFQPFGEQRMLLDHRILVTHRRGPNFPCCNTVRMFSGVYLQRTQCDHGCFEE